MARRGREAALKRAREKARQDKREAKREKKERAAESGDEPITNENALMEEFARLSEAHEAGRVSAEKYNLERHRIFVDLGLESEN